MTFDADNGVTPTNFIKKKSVTFDKTDNIINIVTRDHEENQLNGLTGTVNNLNQYTQFDQWGFSHDANGNTSQKGTQSFTYDYKNRLITTSDGSVTVNFKYDVLGRRIEKSIGSNSTKYFYAKNRVIEERDGTDEVTKQYIYGNGIDEIIRMDNNESGTMTPYYYHTNSIGNVTAITDNTGSLVERTDYDLYGMPTIWDYKTDPNNPTVVSNSLIGNTLLFHGRRYDKETNLYYYRARYYDPITGRFLSTDPMGYKDSMNLYQAFNMNGVNFVDPMGEVVRIDSNLSRKYQKKVNKFLEKLKSTPTGLIIYNELNENKSKIYTILISKTGGGFFEIIDPANDDFTKANVNIGYKNISRNEDELIRQGSPVADSEILDYAKRSMSQSEYKEFKSKRRYKGLKNKYEVLAAILGHEFGHALEAQHNPKFHVYRQKRLEELNSIYINNYLLKYKGKGNYYKDFIEAYPEYIKLKDSIAKEEVEVTYPLGTQITEELIKNHEKQ